jgi:hypothetical protein
MVDADPLTVLVIRDSINGCPEPCQFKVKAPGGKRETGFRCIAFRLPQQPLLKGRRREEKQRQTDECNPS